MELVFAMIVKIPGSFAPRRWMSQHQSLPLQLGALDSLDSHLDLAFGKIV